MLLISKRILNSLDQFLIKLFAKPKKAMWSRGAWVLLGLASNNAEAAITVSGKSCQIYADKGSKI